MKLKKTKPICVLGVACAEEGNPHVFLGCGDEDQNPFFGRREGGTSSNPHPKELNFVTVINSVKDCFVLDGLRTGIVKNKFKFNL